VNTAINCRVPKDVGKFLSSCTSGGLSRKAMLREVSTAVKMQIKVFWVTALFVRGYQIFWTTQLVHWEIIRWKGRESVLNKIVAVSWHHRGSQAGI
jgi:hypothetical protein